MKGHESTGIVIYYDCLYLFFHSFQGGVPQFLSTLLCRRGIACFPPLGSSRGGGMWQECKKWQSITESLTTGIWAGGALAGRPSACVRARATLNRLELEWAPSPGRTGRRTPLYMTLYMTHGVFIVRSCPRMSANIGCKCLIFNLIETVVFVLQRFTKTPFSSLGAGCRGFESRRPDT